MHKKREEGIILILSILFISVFILLTIPFLMQVSAHFRLTEKSYKSLAAFNLAEAGVERAIWEVNHGDISSWEGDSAQRTIVLSSIQAANGKDVGDVEITILGPTSENPMVISRGSVLFIGTRTVDKTVRVVLAHGFESFFNFGIFGDEGFDLHGSAYIDSYNSIIGPYDPLHPGSYGDVGTNATDKWDVVLLNNTLVNGNAITGYQSDPEVVIRLRNNARITGVMTTLEQPKPLPAYAPPTLSNRGSFYLPTGSSEVVIRESGEYSSFIMESNTTVTISGKVTLYVNGSFLMNSNSNLNITSGSEVEIILGDGIFRQESNCAINNLAQNPKNLAIMGTGEFRDMIWQSNTDFYGVVYVPEAHVEYNANHDFFGSIICNYLTLASQSGIHYDESLAIWKKYGVKNNSYVVKSWQQKS